MAQNLLAKDITMGKKPRVFHEYSRLQSIQSLRSVQYPGKNAGLVSCLSCSNSGFLCNTMKRLEVQGMCTDLELATVRSAQRLFSSCGVPNVGNYGYILCLAIFYPIFYLFLSLQPMVLGVGSVMAWVNLRWFLLVSAHLLVSRDGFHIL